MDIDSDPPSGGSLSSSPPPFIDLPSQPRLNQSIWSSSLKLPTSTDPLRSISSSSNIPTAMETSSDPISASVSCDRKKFSLNKRKIGQSSSDPTEYPKPPKLNRPTTNYSFALSADDAMYAARDKILEAYKLTFDRDRQTRILDLLQIFREFTENNFLPGDKVKGTTTAPKIVEKKSVQFIVKPTSSSGPAPLATNNFASSSSQPTKFASYSSVAAPNTPSTTVPSDQ